MPTIKQVHIETIDRPERFLESPLLTKEEIEAAIEKALKQVYVNMDYFGEDYPTPATFDNIYQVMDNTE